MIFHKNAIVAVVVITEEYEGGGDDIQYMKTPRIINK